MALAKADKEITALTLHFGKRGVYLENGEPLSMEEAEEIRQTLTRYLESELPYVQQNGGVYPAYNAAYDRFVAWAVEHSNPDEDGGWNDLMYADHKSRRARRIKSATANLSSCVTGKSQAEAS